MTGAGLIAEQSLTAAQCRADVRFTSNSRHYCGASKIRSPGWRAMPLANYVRDFEGIALPLRTNVRFTPSEGITQFVPSREARVYDSGVGPGLFLGVLLRFDSPDDGLWQAKSLGR